MTTDTRYSWILMFYKHEYPRDKWQPSKYFRESLQCSLRDCKALYIDTDFKCVYLIHEYSKHFKGLLCQTGSYSSIMISNWKGYLSKSKNINLYCPSDR